MKFAKEKNRSLSFLKFLANPIIICSFILFSSFYLSSQPYTYGVDEKSLTGKVVVFSSFVNTLEGHFDEEEIEYILENFYSSLAWMEEQAENYGQELEFDPDYFYRSGREQIYVDEIKRHVYSKTVLEKVLRKLGYASKEEFYDRNLFDPAKQKMTMVLFVKDNDRSHARIPYMDDGIRVAVVYCFNPYQLKRVKNVISHEILHLFGAWDLYHEYGRSQTLESTVTIRKEYLNSIMRSTFIENNVVDEITASLVGWSEYKEEFDQFDSRKNQEQISKEARDKSFESGTVIKFSLKGKKKKTDKKENR